MSCRRLIVLTICVALYGTTAVPFELFRKSEQFKAEGGRLMADVKAEGGGLKADVKAEGLRLMADVKAEGLGLKAEVKSPCASLYKGGNASYYGKGFHGKLTANGEKFDSWGMTCAHRTLPLGSWVSFRNPLNGRVALARVNDRGPFRPGREFDLSEGVYRQLAAGMEEVGLLKVEWRTK